MLKKRDIYLIIILCCIITGVILKQEKQSNIMINSEQEKAKETLAVYVENNGGNYVEADRMPGSDYVINESKSYCYTKISKEHDTSIKMYTKNGKHIISNLGKDNKCHLYFDKSNNVSSILAKYTKNTSRTGQITAGFKESTPTTVYNKEDDDGTSYIFAGVNPNNWVRLGNLYFRIIRFNGDGTMRLIYSGEGSAKTSGAGTVIGYNKFNNSLGNNMNVGLQYTDGNAHGTGTNSTILGTSTSTDATTLYGWYNSKIKPSYASIIDSNVGFCSDRRNTNTENGIIENPGNYGTGNTVTYYRAYITYYKNGSWQTTFNPELKCLVESDNLKLPVGLITADEYMLAGGGVNSSGYYNATFWLHTGIQYYTMSPCNQDSAGYSWMFIAHSTNGYLSKSATNDPQIMGFSHGIRPVINLKASTTFENGGTGTSNNPYVVKIN